MCVATTVQYKFLEKTENVTTITFRNSSPLLEVTQISYYREEDLTGILAGKFRYSFDGATWTNYQTLSQININRIPFNAEPEFYFEVVYTRTGILSGAIRHFYLIYEGCEMFPTAPVVDASIDADFLQGQPPLYYLDRQNHIGKYLDFLADNAPGLGFGTLYEYTNDASNGINMVFRNIDASGGLIISDNGGTITITDDPNIDASVAVANIGYGTAQIFAGWDASTIMNLRSLSSSGVVSITQDASNIIISVDPNSFDVGFDQVLYSSQLDPSIVMTTEFRNFPSGTTVYDLQGRYLESIINDILFPTVYPDLTAPSSNFTDNVDSLFEPESVLSIQFTASFDRGSIDIDNNFQNYRSGLPTSYNYTDPSSNSLLIDVTTSALSNIQTITGFIVKPGLQVFSVDITYAIGPQPLDNKGNNYGSRLNGGTTTSSITLEGAYPNYATTSSINTMTKQTLISMLTSNNIEYTLVAEQDGDKQKIDIPKIWTDSIPLVGIKQLNTNSQIWEYPGGSAATSLTFWTISLTSHVINTDSIIYNKYTYNGADRSSVQIRLIY